MERREPRNLRQEDVKELHRIEGIRLDLDITAEKWKDENWLRAEIKRLETENKTVLKKYRDELNAYGYQRDRDESYYGYVTPISVDYQSGYTTPERGGSLKPPTPKVANRIYELNAQLCVLENRELNLKRQTAEETDKERANFARKIRETKQLLEEKLQREKLDKQKQREQTVRGLSKEYRMDSNVTCDAMMKLLLPTKQSRDEVSAASALAVYLMSENVVLRNVAVEDMYNDVEYNLLGAAALIHIIDKKTITEACADISKKWGSDFVKDVEKMTSQIRMVLLDKLKHEEATRKDKINKKYADEISKLELEHSAKIAELNKQYAERRKITDQHFTELRQLEKDFTLKQAEWKKQIDQIREW